MGRGSGSVTTTAAGVGEHYARTMIFPPRATMSTSRVPRRNWTSTPGTIWLNYDAAKGTLLLHVLDLVDETVWIRTIKGRYERLLMEIFE